MINPDITYNQVYYVESPYIRNLVAIRPHIKDDLIEWEDTDRGSHASIEKIRFTPSPKEHPEAIPEKIEIITNEGEPITLRKLTLPLYDKEVREYVAGKPKFESEEELQKYYLDTNFQDYE